MFPSKFFLFSPRYRYHTRYAHLSWHLHNYRGNASRSASAGDEKKKKNCKKKILGTLELRFSNIYFVHDHQLCNVSVRNRSKSPVFMAALPRTRRQRAYPAAVFACVRYIARTVRCVHETRRKAHTQRVRGGTPAGVYRGNTSSCILPGRILFVRTELTWLKQRFRGAPNKRLSARAFRIRLDVCVPFSFPRPLPVSSFRDDHRPRGCVRWHGLRSMTRRRRHKGIRGRDVPAVCTAPPDRLIIEKRQNGSRNLFGRKSGGGIRTAKHPKPAAGSRASDLITFFVRFGAFRKTRPRKKNRRAREPRCAESPQGTRRFSRADAAAEQGAGRGENSKRAERAPEYSWRFPRPRPLSRRRP